MENGKVVGVAGAMFASYQRGIKLNRGEIGRVVLRRLFQNVASAKVEQNVNDEHLNKMEPSC